FRLKNVRNSSRGGIELKISKDGFSPWYNFDQPTGMDDLAVTLNSKTYFEGAVLAPDGKPVPNALIRANCGPKKNPNVTITTVWLETHSDKAGRYKLFVWPDSYELIVRVPKVGVLRNEGNAIAEGEAKAHDIQLEPPIALKVNCRDSE